MSTGKLGVCLCLYGNAGNLLECIFLGEKMTNVISFFFFKNTSEKGRRTILQLCFCTTPWFTSIHVAAAAKSLQSCPTLCDPIDGGPPGSPVPGILEARTLEWVAISFSNAWKWKVKVKLLGRVLTLCDPMDCSPPGSSIHGIFQARVLEWGAIAFSNSEARGSQWRFLNREWT